MLPVISSQQNSAIVSSDPDRIEIQHGVSSIDCLIIFVSGFVNHIERLFDENVLIGNGWTAHESMRPLAYSTLADLVHHVRANLPMSDLALAVDLFSKNIHNDSLPSSIQTMSCKLLLNLVESIRTKSDQENGNVSLISPLLHLTGNHRLYYVLFSCLYFREESF